MKPTPLNSKAALSELFKSIKLASSRALKSSTAKRTLPAAAAPQTRWEKKFDEITESLYGPLPMTDREARNLAGELNNYLVSELEKRATKNVEVPVTDHFMDLFTALNTISTPSNPTNTKTPSKPLRGILRAASDSDRVRLISTSTDPEELKHYLTELFYNSRLKESYATAILRNKSFKDVKLMERLLFNTGYYRNTMKAWSLNHIRLQIANKYWSQGDRNSAYSLIVERFESVWVPALEGNIFPGGNSIEGLIKALLAFKREDLLASTIETWKQQLTDLDEPRHTEYFSTHDGLGKSLLSIWTVCVKTRRYSLAQQCVSCASAYYAATPSKPDTELSSIVFEFLSLLHTIPPKLAFTSQKTDALIQSLGKTEGNILGSMVDAASELRELEGLDATERALLNQFVFSRLKPYLEQRINAAPGDGQQQHKTISTALALQKLKTLENKTEPKPDFAVAHGMIPSSSSSSS